MAAMLMVSCDTSRKQDNYEKTSDGLYYHFHKQNVSGASPQTGDFLRLKMACYLADTLYYDWADSDEGIFAQLSAPKFAGDLQSAFAMMHVGDSASFRIKADSIAVKYYKQDPAEVGLTPKDYFRYEIRLDEVMTEEEFQLNLTRKNMEMQTPSPTDETGPKLQTI